MTDQAPEPRRRRRRASAAEGPPPVRPAEPGTPKPTPPEGRAKKRRQASKARGDGTSTAADRGMRDLVGSGRSALGVDGALRGRDVNRPTDEDLAEAEREVQIVRRHWRPPAERG
jgi:hypothetical protein